jgi:hypothetical protein
VHEASISAAALRKTRDFIGAYSARALIERM